MNEKIKFKNKRIERFKKQESQDEAYRTYAENIQFSQKAEKQQAWFNVFDDATSSLKESFSKLDDTQEKPEHQVMTKKIGRAIINNVAPFATNLIQSHTFHAKRAKHYREKKRNIKAQQYEHSTSALTISLKDAINFYRIEPKLEDTYDTNMTAAERKKARRERMKYALTRTLFK